MAPDPDAPSLATRIAELVIAALVIALGVYVVWQTPEIRVPRSEPRIGPRAFPYIIGIGTIVLGIWLVLEIVSGRGSRATDDAEDADTSLPTDWRCLAILAAALFVFLVLLERAGFILANAVLFFLAAFGMGSRRILRDIAIGLVLSVTIYYVFTEGLDLRLPAGWLEVLE